MERLTQENKDLGHTYQAKMQSLIKEKDDLAAAFQHVEAKFSDAEMDREKLKLLL